ncbi:MAG: replication initiation protein RepC, partial [Planctomycetota bacterium]
SRLIASLETKGIVLRHYSANGKRWGLRGADDALVDGRGIDLSPLLSRLPAWRRALAEHQSAEAAHAHRARTITERRVRLRETIDAFVGSNADDRACDLLAALEDAVPPVWRTSRALRAAQDADLFQLEGRLAEIEVAVDELAEGMLAEQHKEQNDEFKESARADHRDIHQTRPKTQPDFSTSAQPRADTRDRPQSASLKTNKKNERRKAKAVSVAILKDALPTFWDQFGWIGLNDLNGFVRAAETAKSMIRVDERLWGEAHIALDHNRVLVAMLSAYVFERLNTEGPHGLSNPDGVGGYFRRCVERAAEGRLHLDASLYAAAQRHRKRQAEADDDLI